MHEIFNLDNGFFRMISKVVDAIWISILWVVCCIPIITVGASTTAFYYTVHKTLRHDEGYISKEFFHAFKTNFKQSTICWIILLACGAFLYVDARLTYSLKEQNDPVGNIFYLIIFLFVILAVEIIYIFPYISRFSDNIRTTLKNAFFLALGNPLRTIVIIITTVIAGYILWNLLNLIVIVPALYMLAIEQMMERNYKKFLPKEETDEDMEKPIDGKRMGLFAAKKMKSKNK
jgi:uncharacterized membrane protein YesL